MVDATAASTGASARSLAFGSLLLEGRPVRLAGQDSRRGTFGQRHAMLVDRDDRRGAHAAAATSTSDQATFYVYDSLLSEFAAMGFEYGYSVARPEALVLLGGAVRRLRQRRADDHRRVHLSSARPSGASAPASTLLLPHGYEGQGPDHSSARIERFLQLCAEDNMTVAYPTTPAQYFHLLRAPGARRGASARSSS